MMFLLLVSDTIKLMKKFSLHFISLVALLLSMQSYAQKNKIDSLLTELKSVSSDTQKVNLLNILSAAYNDRHDSSALTYSKKSIDLATESGFEKGLARAYGVYAFAKGNLGNFSEEISYHKKAIDIYEKLDDSKALAKEYGNLAIAEWNIGDYPPATSHCLQSIREYDKSGNKYGEAISLMTLGNIYFDQKNYPEAINCYARSKKLNRESNNVPMFDAMLMIDIGNIYNRRKQNDSALYFYNSVLPVFEGQGNPVQKSVLLNNIGTIYEDQKKYDEAMVKFRESFLLRSSVGDSDGVCSVYQNFGNVFADKKEFDSAFYYYNAALGLAQRMGSRSQEATVYNDLFNFYADQGKYKEAYEYQSKYLDLNDSLTGAENQNSVNELRERFDAEKRDAQIHALETNAKLEQEHSQRNIMMMLVVVLGTLLVASFFYWQYRNKKRTSDILEIQNAEITLQKKSITDSINYAKKIQDSILPPESQIRRVLPNSFILYEPKDVVSGDFYWLDSRDKLSIFAAVDCTGHGVPGAMMSVVGFNLLNQAVNEMGLTKPSDILHHLDFGVNKLLRQSDEGNSVKDGMDIALCTYDSTNRKLQYAGVFNPAYIISKGEFIQLKPDKFPIGINADGVTDDYTNHEHQLFPGDMIYLFSDGYADQFGGSMGKKYKYTRFRDLLMKIHSLSVEEQKNYLRDEYVSWKGNLEQVDDILVIGVRVE
jgi:serine phosphatase RsbU (regulator of sigma subunit)/Tfp pilus assembly protein PilF